MLTKGCVQYSLDAAATCPFYVLYTILSMSLAEDHKAKRLLDDRLSQVLTDELTRLPKNSGRLTYKELFSIRESFKLLARLAVFSDFAQPGMWTLVNRLQAAASRVSNDLSGYTEPAKIVAK